MHLMIKLELLLAKVCSLYFTSGYYFEMNLGGESIKEINRKSGAFVELDKAYVPAIGNSSDRVFKLRGTADQIVAAQQLMYEKIINSPGGPGDMLTPMQFQQQFNLPLVGSKQVDAWSGSNDPYGNDTNGAAATVNDPYSQWASAYGQWPSSKNKNYFPKKKEICFC